MNTFEKIASLMAEQLGVDKASITPESEIIKDLGADSLDVVEMLLDLEKEYGVEISDEQAAELKTVGDIVKLIENK
ncbi:MAG: acyl carrier protein [Clostridiales bacterium]|nr:acyl carrier protein [Clostridiales bacterium]